jgi:hypothetical protein
MACGDAGARILLPRNVDAIVEAMCRRLLFACCALLASACATVQQKPEPAPAPIPRNVEPPPPPVNLSGFPLPYRQGFADGCASASGAERKDATRYPTDGNYRTGWQDGIAQCRRRK